MNWNFSDAKVLLFYYEVSAYIWQVDGIVNGFIFIVK